MHLFSLTGSLYFPIDLLRQLPGPRCVWKEPGRAGTVRYLNGEHAGLRGAQWRGTARFAVPGRRRQPNKGNIIPCAGEGMTWTHTQNSSAVLRAL